MHFERYFLLTAVQIADAADSSSMLVKKKLKPLSLGAS